jgi:hypothetical protein
MSRQQRITDFHSASAVQIATLDELAKTLRADGLDEEARIVERVVVELELPGDPGERVARAMPHIKALGARMHEIGEPTLVKAVEHVRVVLVRYADPTLVDTQEIDLNDLKR